MTDIQIPQNYDEAYAALRDMVNWARENDLPMQDYLRRIVLTAFQPVRVKRSDADSWKL